MSEWSQVSHAHKIWTGVSSLVPHFLQMGLSLRSITYKCRLRALCPVRRSMTILDCALLKDNNRALLAKSGLEINSWACLCVLQGQRHIIKCSFSINRFIFLLMFCLETPKKGSGPTYEGWTFNSGNYLFTTDKKYIHVSKFYCPSV